MSTIGLLVAGATDDVATAAVGGLIACVFLAAPAAFVGAVLWHLATAGRRTARTRRRRHHLPRGAR